MSVKIRTKSGQVIDSTDSFATIQRAITNKTFIELQVDGRRTFLNPDAIESVDEAKLETNAAIYKNNAASNFPWALTPEQQKEMQMKMQPLKAQFDAKADAMKELKEKEDAAIKNSYAKMYGGFQQHIEDVAKNEPVEEPIAVTAKKRGRPPKAQ